MTVTTRFPPSPTGHLHIGGARTALFNWLYARHHGGKFLLRIEDTDRKRSTPEAIDAIIDGLKWLELDWDGEITYQSRNAERHAAMAEQLLAAGKAYRCYCTPEELKDMREKARAEGSTRAYDRRWRDRDPSEAPKDVDPVVRIKMPLPSDLGGETTIADRVQGEVTIANDGLDDFILLRADGTPTYMLAVVVDDHDAGVTHVIRGDDHLNNAFRQHHLYLAAGWEPPEFAHIPLIHGADGVKMSKRHGATAVQEYRELGYLPAALRNYLVRLGWSHGDDEIFSTEQAIEWFGLDAVNKAPARLDFAKLDSVNAHYIREEEPNDRLVQATAANLERNLGEPLRENDIERLTAAMDSLRQRPKTLVELTDNAEFLVNSPSFPLANAKAAKLLAAEGAIALLGDVKERLEGIEDWTEEAIEAALRGLAESRELGLGKLAQPLRAALTGSNASPGIFEVMAILGRDETIGRISAISIKI